MNKKIIIGALALIGIGAGFFIFNSNKSNENEIILPYGRGRGVDGELSSFNPAKADNTPSAIALHNEVAELLAFDKDGKLVPYAAKSVTTNKDATEVSVELKDGLKYDDGTDVLAKDYYNGAKLLGSSKTRSSYQSWVSEWIVGGSDFAKDKTKEISGFKVINDKKFTIKLTSPRAYFKSTFASEMWSPVPQHFIDKIGGLENYGLTYDKFISSGPMKIKSYNSQKLVVEKNNQTSLSKDVKVNSIKFVPVTTLTSAIAQFKQNKLYAVEKTAETDKALNKNSNADQIFPLAQMEYISVNRKNVDKNLAKAIYLSLDKDYINKNIFDSMYQVRSVITPATYQNVEDALKKNNIDPNKNEFDLEEAKKLSKPYKDKVIKILVKTEKTQDVKYNNYLKYVITQLESLGVKTEIKTLPTKLASKEIYKDANTNRSYDITLNAWSNDYPEASTFVNSILGSHTTNNFSAWTSKIYDENTQKAMTQVDETKAGEYYAKAIIDAKNEYAVLPIVQYKANVYTQDQKFQPYSVAGLRYVNYW